MEKEKKIQRDILFKQRKKELKQDLELMYKEKLEFEKKKMEELEKVMQKKEELERRKLD